MSSENILIVSFKKLFHNIDLGKDPCERAAGEVVALRNPAQPWAKLRRHGPGEATIPSHHLHRKAIFLYIEWSICGSHEEENRSGPKRIGELNLKKRTKSSSGNLILTKL